MSRRPGSIRTSATGVVGAGARVARSLPLGEGAVLEAEASPGFGRVATTIVIAATATATAPAARTKGRLRCGEPLPTARRLVASSAGSGLGRATPSTAETR